jgi:hypothetical protein
MLIQWAETRSRLNWDKRLSEVVPQVEVALVARVSFELPDDIPHGQGQNSSVPTYLTLDNLMLLLSRRVLPSLRSPIATLVRPRTQWRGQAIKSHKFLNRQSRLDPAALEPNVEYPLSVELRRKVFPESDETWGKSPDHVYIRPQIVSPNLCGTFNLCGLQRGDDFERILI